MISMILGVFTLSSFTAGKYDPVGKWKFSAPDAPYGYEAGTIEVKKADDKYTATIMFEDFDYKFEGEKVKFADDKLSLSLYLDGEDIYLVMKFTDKDKLSGKAIYSEGELPLTAKRAK